MGTFHGELIRELKDTLQRMDAPSFVAIIPYIRGIFTFTDSVLLGKIHWQVYNTSLAVFQVSVLVLGTSEHVLQISIDSDRVNAETYSPC